MENVISLVAGVFVKLVDEVYDTKIEQLENSKEYIISLCTFFNSLFLYNNIDVSLLHILIIIPVCLYSGKIDNVYWKTLIPIPFITSLLKIQTFQYTGIMEKLAVFIVAAIYIPTEQYLFPEETSVKKIISRVFLIIIHIFLIYATDSLSSKAFIHSLLYYAIGYFTVSLIIKIFFDGKLQSETPAQELSGAEKNTSALPL